MPSLQVTAQRCFSLQTGAIILVQLVGTALLVQITRISKDQIPDNAWIFRNVDLQTSPEEVRNSVWPPIYWINAPWLVERARGTREMLNKLGANGARINGQTPDDVKRLMLLGHLTVNCTLIDKCVAECWRHRAKNEYTYVEAAHSLGHLNAIKAAFRDNATVAIIIEDDVELFAELPGHLEALIANSPPDWEILQINVKNIGMLHQFENIRDPVVGWHRECFGSGAYVISKAGMISVTSQFAPAPNIIWLPNAPVADWWVYRYAKTFVSTKMLTNLRQNDRDEETSRLRKIVNDMRDDQRRPSILRNSPSRILLNQSFIAITTIRGDLNMGMLNRTIALLRDNMIELRQFNIVMVAWIVLWEGQGATKNDWENALRSYPELADQLDLKVAYRHWEHEFPVFNKFNYYAEMADAFDQYDHVLMFDNDMQFQGFAWHEFFHRLVAQDGKALVSGVVRRTVWPQLHMPDYPWDSYFKYMDSRFWLACDRSSTDWQEVEYVEQWFSVIAGHFLKHLIVNVLLPVHYALGASYANGAEPDLYSAWGPDVIWCGAAHAYGGLCALFPLTMKHLNWKTLTANVDVKAMGQLTLNAFRNARPTWMMKQHVFDIWGHKRCKAFREKCDPIQFKYFRVPDGNLDTLPDCVSLEAKMPVV